MNQDYKKINLNTAFYMKSTGFNALDDNVAKHHSVVVNTTAFYSKGPVQDYWHSQLS
jgi:hypothetical protein